MIQRIHLLNNYEVGTVTIQMLLVVYNIIQQYPK